MILEWNLLLFNVVNAINIRLIRIYGFFSAKILFGYQSKYFTEDALYEDSLRVKMIENAILKKVSFPNTEKRLAIEKYAFEQRLFKLNELRDTAMKKRLIQKEMLTKKEDKETSKNSITTRCLIKFRRLTQKRQHSHKLKTRWEDFYIVHKLTQHEKSFWLREMYIEKVKERYSINDVKLWIEKKNHENSNQNWKSITKINNQIRQNVKQWHRNKIKIKKTKLQTNDQNFDEKKNEKNRQKMMKCII